MRTKQDIAIGIVNIAIDTFYVICGAYMARELYHDVKKFKRG